jgi:hypothetical protein
MVAIHASVSLTSSGSAEHITTPLSVSQSIGDQVQVPGNAEEVIL